MTDKRTLYLDIIRVLACIMVVLMHSPIPSEYVDGQFLTALSYFTAPCIGLFFMVSGALLLPVKTDYVTFIRKRFGKIMIPTIIWSLIYIGVNLYNSESEINILQCLASMPFSPQGEGVLWFMYTLAGLYLTAPILSAWVDKATKREIQIVLALWCATLCYPLFSFYVSINESTTGILYYFTGYAGYFLLGYYLKKYPESISTIPVWCVSIAGIVLLLALKYFGIVFKFYSLFWYESIFIAALAVAMWKAIYKLEPFLNNINSRRFILLSNMTFGVYLMHILIMRHWLWHQEWIVSIANYPLQCMIVAVITMLLSTIACMLIARVPKSEWLIGYHQRRIHIPIT